MPSFNYIIIYDAVTRPVAITSEDFDGGAAEYSVPIVRARYPLTPPFSVDLTQAVVDTEGTAEEYSTPFVGIRYPLEPANTQDLFTSVEDFLGIPTDYSTPVVRIRYPVAPPPTVDLTQAVVDTEGAPEDFRVPMVPSRYLFQSEATPNDATTSSEDFLGGATEHSTPVVLRPLFLASPNPTGPVVIDIPTPPPAPVATGFGIPEIIVLAKTFMGGEQTILGDRFGIPRVRQGARFGAPRIQTNVARFGAVRLQEIT